MKNKFEHGGNIHHFLRTRETNMPILDFSANINPLGLSDTVNQSIHNSISNVVHYREWGSRVIIPFMPCDSSASFTYTGTFIF